MRRTEVRFERDEALDRIDVLVRAPERDAAVAELLQKAGSLGAALLWQTLLSGLIGAAGMGGSGEAYKLFLVDRTTHAPLCRAYATHP